MLAKKDIILTILAVIITGIVFPPLLNTILTSLPYGWLVTVLFITGTALFISTYTYSFVK